MIGPAVSSARLRTDRATAPGMSSAGRRGFVQQTGHFGRRRVDRLIRRLTRRPGTNHRSMGTSRPAAGTIPSQPRARFRETAGPPSPGPTWSIHDPRSPRPASPRRCPATAPAAPPPRRPPEGLPAAPGASADGGTPSRRRTRLPSTASQSSKNGTTRARRRPHSRYNATAAQGSRPKSQRGVAKSMGVREVTGSGPTAVSIGRGGFQPAWVGIAHVLPPGTSDPASHSWFVAGASGGSLRS